MSGVTVPIPTPCSLITPCLNGFVFIRLKILMRETSQTQYVVERVVVVVVGVTDKLLLC
jgi:hypothetical protein